jgi:hypothetical protein
MMSPMNVMTGQCMTLLHATVYRPPRLKAIELLLREHMAPRIGGAGR